ncbi:optic atrophy 3 protein homolog isoform X2 [Drosophila elegans]|uniref:optic atrophy 3 protein homolog isoform X2 n=1 Tax=Drosophila elegans TaxID=30023 RepID=UPI0007E67F27|nr:optic atrophy 3 protein homolog isoform X2 [Drosophila elegans]
MVVGAFPLVKLALLGIKHISKPISNLINQTAKKNQSFKTLVVAPPARLYHVIDVRSKMWMLGLGQPRLIPPLNDAMSIQMGSDILGEMFIFLLGATFIVAEQAKNDRIKQEKQKLHREQLEERISDLVHKQSRQEKVISQLRTMVRRKDSDCGCIDTRDSECN